MALNQSQLEQLLSTVKKTGTNAVPNFASAAVDTKQNSIDSLTKQISNTSARLAAVGEDATKIADTRNPLEKILNLTPDQSFIFDIFELINRPQQALFGAIEEGASGGNVLEGAIGGLTGNKDTNFKEVLQSTTKSDLGDVKGQLDLIDVVGFAGDVFLDPADLSLMMVTGGTSLAGSIASGATDAAKIAGEGVDIAKAAEAGLDIAQEATKGAKSLGVLQDVVFGKGKRLATNLSLEDYVSAVLSNKARTKLGLEGASMTSMTMKSMGGAIKGMSAFGDAAFTHGFKMLDSTGTLSDAYSGLKKGFEQVASDSGRSIKRQIGLAQEKFNTTMLMLRGVDTRYIQWLDKVAKENLPEGADLLQFKGELNIKFLDLFEHKYADNLLNADTVLGFMTNKTHSLPYSEDTINHLFEVFGKENIEPYMTVSQFQNGARYLEFDSNVFNLDENYDFVQGLRLKAEKYTTVFDDKTRKAYEKTLKYSDPVRYSQYQQAVKNYEDGLGKRVAERFEKETGLEPKSTDFNSPKWKEMQKKVEADDIKLTKYRTEQSATNAIVHPQTMLQDPSMIKERYNVWLTKEERKAHLAAMTPEDAKSYRKYIREAMKASGGDADTVERIYIEGDKMLRNAKVAIPSGNTYKFTGLNTTQKELAKQINQDIPKNIEESAKKLGLDPLLKSENIELDKKTLENIKNGPYAKETELVNIDELINYADLDRVGANKMNDIGYIINLADDIIANGYKEPILLQVNPKTGYTLVGEGNHRLIIAKAYGIENVPVRVLRSPNLKPMESAAGGYRGGWFVNPNNIKVRNVLDGVKYYYSDMPPSYIGIGKAPSTKKVVSTMSDLEDVAYSSKLNDAYRQGRIKMGQYGNEATDAYYAKLAADPVVVEGATKFKDTMHEAQRAVGWREFKDEEALMRMGYEGYATHGINQSIVDAFEEIKQKHPEWADKIDFSVFMPGKTRALAARQTYGTTYETNMFLKEWYGKMFGDDAWVKEQFKDADEEFLKDIQKAFTENNMLARESTASLFSFMDDSYSAINKNNKTNQVLLAHTFGNPKAQGAAFQAIGSGDEVPLTHTLMKEKDVRKTITTLEANIKVAGENAYTRSLINELKSTLNKGGNRVPIMEKHVYERLVHVNEISPKKAIALIDAINSGFKIGKTLNPAFNVKNVTGHLVNQWLAGVPMSQIIPNWNAAFRMRKEMSLIDNKIIEGGIASLTKGEIDLFDTYQEFLDAGFMTRSSVYRLNDLDPNARWTDPMSSKKNFDSIYNNFMTRGNMQGNLVMDNTARLSTYLFAKSHPEFIKKLGIDIAQPDAAMQAVRLVHFDPNDLTFFEDDVMKRLVPFYTFTRQNMAFQIKNLTRHSERYNKLFKAYNSWNTNVMDLASGDTQQYQRDQFYVPVWKKENGEYVMVKTSLPVAALTEFSMDAQQTAQNIVSKTTPLVRMPFEAATGVQTLTGQPIERYAGELSTRIPLPGMTKSMEWLWSQTGWDVPAATLVQTGKAAYNVATGQSVGTEIEKALNLYSSVNPQDAQLSKLYSTIESLSAREKVLKSKGVEIPTLDAIQSASANNKLSVQSAQLQKITDLINNIKR